MKVTLLELVVTTGIYIYVSINHFIDDKLEVPLEIITRHRNMSSFPLLIVLMKLESCFIKGKRLEAYHLYHSITRKTPN